MLLSPEYVVQLKLLHSRQTWGASGYSHVAEVEEWCRLMGCRTILDFGCGRGTLKPCLISAGIEPDLIAEYDPGIPGKDALPEPADLLVATDVLEHIETRHVTETLEDLRRLAAKAAFFTIALTHSKVKLPDGRNAHLTLLAAQQWRSELKRAGFRIMKHEMRKGLFVWAI